MSTRRWESEGNKQKVRYLVRCFDSPRAGLWTCGARFCDLHVQHQKLEQKLQNLAPAFKVFTLKQREYEEIIKTIMSTPEFQYNFTEKEISVEEVEDLLKELAETRRVTVKTLTIDAKRVIPINFFGTPISQPSVKITLELERVKQ